MKRHYLKGFPRFTRTGKHQPSLDWIEYPDISFYTLFYCNAVSEQVWILVPPWKYEIHTMLPKPLSLSLAALFLTGQALAAAVW